MKKRMLLISLTVIVGIIGIMNFALAQENVTITTPINETTTTPVCSDSDNGKDYYVKGEISGSVPIEWAGPIDMCTGDTTLRETYCDPDDENGDGYLGTAYLFNCPNGCRDGACITSEETSEQVKCVFANSNKEQKCYTAEQNSRAYCYGVESCVTNISGYKGEKITWKSTCGGYDYTVIDGVDNNVDFDCKNILNESCQPTKCDDGSVYECKIGNGQCICPTCPGIIIKPVCGNGICEGGEGEICACPAIETKCEEGKECTVPACSCAVICPQDCKQVEPRDIHLNEKFKLQVYQSVDVLDDGNYLMKITFKDLIAYKCKEETVSTEASETIESKIAIATGKAVASTGTTSTGSSGYAGGGTTITPAEILKCIGAGPKALLDIDMIVKNISEKHHILNLDVGEKKQVGKFTVSFLNYDYASRTGVFLVSRETFSCPKNCKCDENVKIIECAEKCEKGKTLCPDGVCRDKCSIISEDCKYGCAYGGNCFPIGVRSSGMYCGVDLNMNSQLKADEKCENNFECSTNLCIDNKCISSGLIQRVLNWFRKLFGGK